VWQQLEDDLAALSSNSKHHHVVGTTHESLVYRQQDARATSDAISKMIAAMRK
jgi:hypothetical protein